MHVNAELMHIFVDIGGTAEIIREFGRIYQKWELNAPQLGHRHEDFC